MTRPSHLPVLRVRGVEKQFGARHVLNGVTFDVNQGEVVVVIGPSGSGKSTLLRTINHVQPPTRGHVFVMGELIGYRRSARALYRLPERALLRQRSRIGFVFQNFNLFPHMTALDNVAEAPVSALGRSHETALAEATELLDRVGLSEHVRSYPRQLSGGQQQRVAIARALAGDPELILFDEPTSALDPELVEEVLHVIQELAHAGRTLVIVTHEMGFARRIADRIVFMDDGRIIEQGPALSVLDRPQHPRTREFLAKVN